MLCLMVILLSLLVPHFKFKLKAADISDRKFTHHQTWARWRLHFSFLSCCSARQSGLNNTSRSPSVKDHIDHLLNVARMWGARVTWSCKWIIDPLMWSGQVSKRQVKWKRRNEDLEQLKAKCVPYLIWIDAIIDGPGGLEILQHALLQTLWQMMDTYEVLEVFGSGVVLGPAWVHPLDYGCDITKD